MTDLMTGQEWYERFCSELHKATDGKNTVSAYTGETLEISRFLDKMREIARRASNI